jgi:hypothetical protein
MMFFIILLFLVGIFFCVTAIRESLPLRFDVTTHKEMIRLKQLNSRIRRDTEITLSYSRSCFKTFGILARTKYRKMPDPVIEVLKDYDWIRLRKMVMISAKKGYKHCQDLLNISMENSSVFLIREAFAYSQQCCRECPFFESEEVTTCPVEQVMASGAVENE